jgi:predicted ATPase
MSIGHGGQILISNTTAELIWENLPANTTLKDLGEQRLKDLARPEHVFQLVHPSLPSEFPPPRSFDAVPNNLPIQLTSFIGREKEIAEIKGLLQTSRLVTLTGSGGTGKTRLALEVAALVLAGYPHGVWNIELATLSDPSQIIPAMAQVFGLQELPSESLAALVINFLRAKKALLILDNCEHLIEACARLVDELLHQCTQLIIVASSREALGIAGEVAYRIPSMGSAESIQLFVERARAVNPKFKWTEQNASAVTQICSRLDGIPLAIELAAARARMLSPEQIADRLNDRFRLLVGGSRTAIPRQQTLRALIDWSYDLLMEEEKQLLQTASVFVGGWTLEAIEAITEESHTLENLEQLVNKSLVVADERRNEMRYSLLETVRQYAREELLDSGKAAQVRERHFVYFDRLSDKAWDVAHSFEMALWQTNLDEEIENFRAALEWGLEHHPEQALHLATNTGTILEWTGNLTEARAWIKLALDRCDRLPPVTGEAFLRRQRLRIRARLASASAESAQGDNQIVLQNMKEAVALARQIGDKTMLGYCLEMYATAAHFVGASGSIEAAEEGLAVLRTTGDPWGLAQAYLNMALRELERGNVEAREAFTRDALAALKAANAPYLTAVSLFSIGMAERMRGDLDTAQRYFEEGLVLFRQLRSKHFENVMQSELGHIARQKSDFVKSLEIYRNTIRRWQELGSRAAIANQLECFAFLSLAQGQLQRAARLFGAAEDLREKIKTDMTPHERLEYERSVAQLRSKLAEAELKTYWEEGRALNMEQAVQFALEE